jgi:NAD(P)-dependent dehydrogenase (short-subunit alcohol dehydrogenase family)
MDISGRHVVVTGAAAGIGEALARRFHAAGARVVVADIAAHQARAVASSLDATGQTAFAVAADVGTQAGNEALISAAEAGFGPVDLFFANAGVGAGRLLDNTTEAEWNLAFDVNVHAHRWAAQRLMPGWLDRGEGYFCSTASAAGLLSQIGSAAYSMTKHAAVAFAEWLSITYGEQGLRVSCLCPQGVNTNMLRQGDDPNFGASSNVVRAAADVLEPDDVAETVHRAIIDERFLILPHPEVATYMQRKAGDHDRWLGGMRRLQARVSGGN